MMKIKKSKIIIITMLLLCFALSIMPMKVFAATEISKVQIGSVKYDYNVGDKPEATAEKYSSVGDYSASYYDIEYEYWEEMEKSATTGELEPVKFWYSDENKNADLAQDKSIITFEENKSYMYSISLKARDGYTFAENTEVYVNGKKVNTISIGPDGKTMFVTAIKTMQPKTQIYKHISEVEINNATISFKVGDKPVFSGTTPENVPYIYQSEFWSTDGGKKYYYAADFWNINNPDDLFTKFESGKSYTYGIYFKAEEGYCFTADTKLKINGKYYDYDTSEYDPMLQYNEGEYATMWIHNTGLVITPKSEKLVDLIEITDVTTKFNVGDAPKFTGKVADNALYEIDYEGWSGDNEIITTSEYWNNRFKDWGNAPLTSFKANTEYSYTIYVKLTDEAVKDGYYFDKDKTKLSINGEFINIDSKYVGIDEGNPTVATFGEVLKMTPIENSQGNPTTPSEPEKPSQETEKEPQTTENKTEQTKNETNNPKTGDNITTSIMLFVASIATIGTLTIVKRKKSRE